MSPVFFVKKLSRKIQFCIDYQKLNTIAKKEQYAIRLIEETLAQLKDTEYFTQIDIQQAFYQITMLKDLEALITFFIRFSAFKY